MVKQQITWLRSLAMTLVIFADTIVAGTCDSGDFLSKISVTNAPSITTTSAYDPFSSTEIRKSGSATISNSHTSLTCSGLKLRFVDQTQSTPINQLTSGTTSDQIPFKITTTGGNTQLIGTTSEIIVGDLVSNGGTAVVNFDLVIPGPALTAIATATYSDIDIKFKFVFTNSGSSTIKATPLLAVSTWVADTVDVSMNTTYKGLSSASINFGTLSTGLETRSVSFSAFSNVDYHINFSSLNDGKMVKTGASPAHIYGTLRDNLPYFIRVGAGGQQSLSTAPTKLVSATKTAIAGTTTTLYVDLDADFNVTYPLAGTYTDTITLEIATGL